MLFELIGNRGDKGSTSNQLKAIEMIAKTMGVFEEKVVVENVNADSVLTKILERAKRVHEDKQELIELENEISQA